MTSFEEIQEKYKPFIGTVVFDCCLKPVLLHGIVEDERDLYYDYETPDKGRVLYSCVAWCIGLKGLISDKAYEYVEYQYNFSKERHELKKQSPRYEEQEWF